MGHGCKLAAARRTGAAIGCLQDGMMSIVDGLKNRDTTAHMIVIFFSICGRPGRLRYDAHHTQPYGQLRHWLHVQIRGYRIGETNCGSTNSIDSNPAQ
jgi:hypothetical protein